MIISYFIEKFILAAIENGYTAKEGLLQKVEVATLIVINITGENLSIRNELLEYYQNIAVINIIIDDKPFSSWVYPTEAYTGQKAYTIFLHVDIATGEITTAPNQPKNIFGINKLIKKALDGDVNKPVIIEQKIPIFTIGLIAINTIVLILMYIEGYPHDPWVPLRFGAIMPRLVFAGQWYRLFTAMFIHFGIIHFFANITALLIFGTRIERYFGKIKFLTVYILTGLTGSLASLFLTQGYAAGASGAIYGLIGMMFLYTRLTGRAIAGLNWYIMFIFIILGIAMGYIMPNIDNFAHMGGLLSGAVFGIVIAKVRILN